MKKTMILSALIFLLLAMLATTGCKKKSPQKTAQPAAAIDYQALVPVPGGTLIQADKSNRFKNTISAFRLGKYKVTYDLWYSVYHWAIVNGCYFQDAGTEGSGGTIGAAPTSEKLQPVTTISWRDAVVWCNAYSLKTGLTPVYYSDETFTKSLKSSLNGQYGNSINAAQGSIDNPYVNWKANGYRLPTEAEYQLAAGYIDGSNRTPDNYASGAAAAYTNEAATDLVGWDNVNSGGAATKAVGGLAPNALGIYDMSGNVWEWCWDWYGPYPNKDAPDYKGHDIGSTRSIRGGSCYYGADAMQTGCRSNYAPYNTYGDIGFRIARTN